MLLTSWPGGESAWDTEAEAQAEAQRKVREGIQRCVVWERNDEPSGARSGERA